MIQFICFSRKRPLQLHGYLESLFRHCPKEVDVSVLIKVDPEYSQAYQQVKELFPNVYFLDETDFCQDIQTLIDRSSAEFLSFGCDDVIFVAPVLSWEIERAFGRINNLVGLSLRLGNHITQDMFGHSLETPEFWAIDNRWLRWDTDHSVGDWAYRWEVLGTFYRTEFAKQVVAAVQPGSPSQLEDRGSRKWSELTPYRQLSSWENVRIVVPTVNMIQHEFGGNGIRGSRELSPEFLLGCWQNGLRMDVERYVGMTPPSWRIGDFYLTNI